MFFEAKVGFAREVFPTIVEERNIRRDTWNVDSGAICMDRIGWPAQPWFPGTLPVLAWKTRVLGAPSVSGRPGWLVILWAESPLEALEFAGRTEFANPRVMDARKVTHYRSRLAAGRGEQNSGPYRVAASALWPTVTPGRGRPVLSKGTRNFDSDIFWFLNVGN